ncbi:MAG: tetratricopeptide repeat protein [Sulfuricella sp.]|nr:tetratricopeptide repeat protein [Sulfuricella sp.]
MSEVDLLDECVSYKKRGNAFLADGNLAGAEKCYRQAVAINPDYAEGFLNLGFVLKEQGVSVEAERHLRRAILINPKLEDAYYILGSILQERGDSVGAISCYETAIELKPDFQNIYVDLCHLLFLNGQIDKAKKIILQGIQVYPQIAEFHGSLGNLYVYEMQLEKAIACYQKALSLQPNHALTYSNLGKAYIELGNIDEAVRCYQKTLSLDPSDLNSQSCLLFIQSFNAKCSPAQRLKDALSYGKKAISKAKPYTYWHACHRSEGNLPPLKVGLVSGDLKNHPVGFFLESILVHLDRSKIELVAYPTQTQEDELTARIRPCFAAWNTIAGLDDEAAAHRIHDDEIHVLIDLSGHTTYNRLPVFAWKPAPVQVSWLGYFASTGVPGMDFLLADRVSVPESHRNQFSETVWYLPDTRLCFTPPAANPRLALTPLPAVRNGFVTFGCFQNVGKVNDAVLALWGKIFHLLPQAQLRLQNKQMDCPEARKKLLQRLAYVGISQERVVIEGPMSREDYLAAHADVDIILDTFPYPGGTTTCEALWMGVPTLTLAGDVLLARQGASMLICAGLDEWIADNEDGYIELALEHSADIDRLAQLRSELREKVLASPLFDAPRFARNLEDSLRDMWQEKSQLANSMQA